MRHAGKSRHFERGPLQYALETDWLAEVPVLCEPVSNFGLLISGNREFLMNWGAEQVIRP
jgi:hypothetical protein